MPLNQIKNGRCSTKGKSAIYMIADFFVHLGIHERANRPESKHYGSVRDKTQTVFMKNYDGDSIMKGLWKKVESGQREP